MSALFAEGQGLLAPVCRAVVALQEGGDVDVEGLLWAWRRLQPRCHPGAASDAVDVAAIVDVLRRRPDVLGTPLAAVDDDPRGSPFRQQLARALADACILGLERQKLQHGLRATAAALRQAFASPDDARATLQALADSAPVELALAVAPVAPPLPPVGRGKDLHVVTGAGARRLFDVLSPYVRQLRVDLALLGRNGAVVDDDDVYRGLHLLNARAPGCVQERRDHPAEPRDDGGVFVIDAAQVQEESIDRRARALLAPLKKANVVVVGVVDALLLPSVLAWRPRSVQVLAASTHTGSPATLGDAAHGAVLPLDGDGPLSWSVPWLGLLPAAVDGDEDAFLACTVAWRARIDDEQVPIASVRLAGNEPSAAALAALSALVPIRR